MGIPSERLTTLVDQIAEHVPGALESDVDISRPLQSGRGVKVILRATVQPPWVEVRHELDWEPSAQRPRVLKTWAASLALRDPAQPPEGQELVVRDRQVYAISPADALATGQRNPVEVEGELHVAEHAQLTFVEEAVHIAVAAAQAERQAA